MPFNTLLLTCLTSKTSFAESGGGVKVEPQAGETVIFFAIDDQSNSTCTLRQNLGITGAICDRIVFYAKEGRDKKIVCLVESKGKDLKHAVEQVTNTYLHLRQALKPTHHQYIEWRTFIFQHGAAPKPYDLERIKKKLENDFGKANFKIARNRDLGNFLRE